MGHEDQPRGPDGRWVSRGGGTVVAAVVLALALSSGIGGTGASGLGAAGGSGGTAARSQGTTPGKAKARDRNPADTVRRLERQGLRVEARADSDEGDCASHSYGQVQEFFRTHPCTALFRVLLEVRDARRNVVLVAVAWVDMPDVEQAHQFQRLVDRDGTGNIRELSRESGRYQDVRFTGEYYESVRDDTTVVNAQAQPVGRARGAVALAKLVEEAALSSS